MKPTKVIPEPGREFIAELDGLTADWQEIEADCEIFEQQIEADCKIFEQLYILLIKGDSPTA